MMLQRFGELYKAHIIDPNLQPHFVILVSFLITFVSVRLITHRIRDGKRLLFFHNIEHGDTHIHHLVPGILMLLGAGYALATLDIPREWPAAVYGIGAALTLDEFALWLQLKDVYWEREGRESIDAVIIFAVLAGIGGVCARLLLAIAQEVLHL
jgi:hypothetical protein